ncbi:MAG TPA: hypothetical protein VNS55_03095 [Nocardioides sp.]|nr:hypothetical protein [Nocardioides sp.]
MRARPFVVTSLLVLTACSGHDDQRSGEDSLPSATPASTTSGATPGETLTSPSPTGAVPLPDGYLVPGPYRFVVRVDCEGVKDDPIACPDGVPDPPPIPVELTVPAGWEHPEGFPVVWTLAAPEGQEGALVLGWTSNTVGVQSDPCAQRSHELPDVAVGPAVDDFVDTVVAQPWYDGSDPVHAKVGGAPGRYFTFTGPAHLGRCFEWRPWDPGFFAQGPSNTWEVWVLDVHGHRVVVVADYFPETSRRTIAQLHAMVRSLHFGRPSSERDPS